MRRIIKFIILDIIKNKIILVYTLLLAILSWSTLSLEDNSSKGILTVLNVILLTVPLASVMFSTIYLYNSTEFIELLLSQPIHRTHIWWSLFCGLAFAMLLAFGVGVGLPILLYASARVSVMMIFSGCLISLIFVSLAFLSAVLSRDKAKGIGIAIVSWLFFTLLFDGLVLFLLFQLEDYPIEKMMIGITAFNPIDLSRILILLHLDVAAMMGYTGAIFKEFFGTSLGIMLTIVILILWIILPFFLSLRKFKRKDL